MSAVEQLNSAIQNLQTTTTSAIGRVAEDVAELKRLAESGEKISPEQLEALLSGLSSVTSAIAAIDPVPEFPTQA